MPLRPQPSFRVLTLALAALALCLAPLPAGRAWGQELQREVEAALRTSGLGALQVGVSIINVDTGEVLAGIKERSPFTPASNLKLLTTGSAVLVMGKDAELKTRFVFDPASGRLVVVGCGDPAFADPALLEDMHLAVGEFVDTIVTAAAKKGVTAVAEVVIDDRIFDRNYIHPTWPKEQLNERYCAEVAGLNYHANVLQVFAKMGDRLGAPPDVSTEPSAPFIEILNRARTTNNGASTIGCSRDQADPYKFILAGNLIQALKEPVEVTLHDPPAFFGRILADRLHRAGLTLEKNTAPPVRLADRDEVFAGSTVAVVSTTLRQVIDRCNVDSQNLYAESLLKRVGHDVTGQSGSWSSGASVVRMQVNERVGLDAGDLVMTDGSGLSRDNKVTPLLFTRWLSALAKDPKLALPPGAGDASTNVFVDSLPLAGAEGTLAKRFKGKTVGNEIRGKSGYIRGVQNLSGYVTSPSTGKRVVYSVLVNTLPNKDGRCPDLPGGGKAKAFHEAVVLICDRWLTEQNHAAAKGQPPEKEPALGG